MVSPETSHGHIPSFPNLEGRLALDFANTLSNRLMPEPRERLGSYDALVDWALAVQLIGPTEAGRLRARARAHPADAERAHRCAIGLREAIYGVFHAFATGQRPSPDDLEVLNRTLADGMTRRRLRESEVGYCWAWEEEPEGLDWPLWPVAYSAAELTTTDELERVKECEGADCAWLIYDASRNKSRRWCDMQECGNRVKARRHYEKRVRGRGTPTS